MQQAGVKNITLYEATNKTTWYSVDANTIASMTTSGESVFISNEGRPVFKPAIKSFRPTTYDYTIEFKLFGITQENQDVFSKLKNNYGWYAVLEMYDGRKWAILSPLKYDGGSEVDNNVSNHFDIKLRIDQPTTTRHKDYYAKYIYELLDFDGIDDIIVFPDLPDVYNIKNISLSFHITDNDISQIGNIVKPIIWINKKNEIGLPGAFFLVGLVKYATVTYYYVRTRFEYKAFRIDQYDVINNTAKLRIDFNSDYSIKNLTINDNNLNYQLSGGGFVALTSNFFIGGTTEPNYENNNILIWDINISGINRYLGYPKGNRNEAWTDLINTLNGEVLGNPTLSDFKLIQ